MAVSSLHEGLVELVRKQPALVPDLLTHLLDIHVPRDATARLSESTLNEPRAVEYHADAAVLVEVNEKPVLGAIVEAQLEKRERKRFTWPHYATGARARHECPCVVLVLAPDPAVARWASEPIDLGFGSVFRPHVIGPEQVPHVIDADDAARDLPLAALSATAHGQGDPHTAAQIGLAVAIGATELEDKDQRLLYLGLLENALSDAAKELLKMMPQAPKYFSESQRQSFDKGVAQGIAEGLEKGLAKGQHSAILKVLAKRDLPITEEQRSSIVECYDLATLDRWMDAAFSVSSVAELLR